MWHQREFDENFAFTTKVDRNSYTFGGKFQKIPLTSWKTSDSLFTKGN